MRIIVAVLLLLLLVGLRTLPWVFLAGPIQVFLVGEEGGRSLFLHHWDSKGDAAPSAPTLPLLPALQALNFLGASPQDQAGPGVCHMQGRIVSCERRRRRKIVQGNNRKFCQFLVDCFGFWISITSQIIFDIF